MNYSYLIQGQAKSSALKVVRSMWQFLNRVVDNNCHYFTEELVTNIRWKCEISHVISFWTSSSYSPGFWVRWGAGGCGVCSTYPLPPFPSVTKWVPGHISQCLLLIYQETWTMCRHMWCGVEQLWLLMSFKYYKFQSHVFQSLLDGYRLQSLVITFRVSDEVMFSYCQCVHCWFPNL